MYYRSSRIFRTVIILLMIAVLCDALAGCAAKIPEPADLEYRKIPEAYLQECTLPQVPLDTGDLSEAFVQAYQCGELGNRDKQRIKELVNSPE